MIVLTFNELIKERKKQGLSNSELMKEYDLTYSELRNILDGKPVKNKENNYGKNK